VTTVAAAPRILVACSPGELRVAAVQDGALLDYALWRPGVPDGMGDLCRGRVTARVPAMAGAFVALPGAEGFLPDSEGADAVSDGMAVAVRVTRSAQGGKGQYGSVKPLLELPMALLKRFARHRRALNDAN